MVRTTKQFKPKVSRTPTSEDIQKQDIVFRWVDALNARSFLERRIICGEGSTTKPLAWFIEKFSGFFHATKFYVPDDKRKKVEGMFGKMHAGKINPRELLDMFDEYAQVCYVKGMFIEEEAVGEEGF